MGYYFSTIPLGRLTYTHVNPRKIIFASVLITELRGRSYKPRFSGDVYNGPRHLPSGECACGLSEVQPRRGRPAEHRDGKHVSRPQRYHHSTTSLSLVPMRSMRAVLRFSWRLTNLVSSKLFPAKRRQPVTSIFRRLVKTKNQTSWSRHCPKRSYLGHFQRTEQKGELSHGSCAF